MQAGDAARACRLLTEIDTGCSCDEGTVESGVMLRLWAAHAAPLQATASGGEKIAFAMHGVSTVSALHDDWRAKGLKSVPAPAAMDFGFTFVALDPNGHRLRGFAPGAACARRAASTANAGVRSTTVRR